MRGGTGNEESFSNQPTVFQNAGLNRHMVEVNRSSMRGVESVTGLELETFGSCVPTEVATPKETNCFLEGPSKLQRCNVML